MVAQVKGIEYTDNESAWVLWRSMSVAVEKKIVALGIWDYRSAVRFRDAIALHLGVPYSFSDLICYICLRRR